MCDNQSLVVEDHLKPNLDEDTDEVIVEEILVGSKLQACVTQTVLAGHKKEEASNDS